MIRCLDASVVVKWLTPEPGSLRAEALIESCLTDDVRMVAPSFLFAEVGSVLRRKARAGLMGDQDAWDLFSRLLVLPLETSSDPEMWRLAWQWAIRSAQPTLYDACYLAVAELAEHETTDSVEFWTADAALLASLGSHRPAWAKDLADWPEREPPQRG